LSVERLPVGADARVAEAAALVWKIGFGVSMRFGHMLWKL
jgi:hypothetical protein